MSSNKVNRYHQNQKAGMGNAGNSRETDSRALAACVHRLEDAKAAVIRAPKSKEAMKAYTDAVRHNQRLWTIFQVALSDPENSLPSDLKILLLNLSRYVDKASFRAVGKFVPSEIDSLININRLIAAGLSKQTADSYQQPQQMPVDADSGASSSLMTSA
ncbi:MAG: hypothetical protein KGI97_06685 [Alphaproteobacteria bacterium]|nr:hypothetical protein [Alphaproteobacteria bacterium]